jgi:hypothetical protein
MDFYQYSKIFGINGKFNKIFYVNGAGSRFFFFRCKNRFQVDPFNGGEVLLVKYNKQLNMPSYFFYIVMMVF